MMESWCVPNINWIPTPEKPEKIQPRGHAKILFRPGLSCTMKELRFSGHREGTKRRNAIPERNPRVERASQAGNAEVTPKYDLLVHTVCYPAALIYFLPCLYVLKLEFIVVPEKPEETQHSGHAETLFTARLSCATVEYIEVTLGALRHGLSVGKRDYSFFIALLGVKGHPEDEKFNRPFDSSTRHSRQGIPLNGSLHSSENEVYIDYSSRRPQHEWARQPLTPPEEYFYSPEDSSEMPRNDIEFNRSFESSGRPGTRVLRNFLSCADKQTITVLAIGREKHRLPHPKALEYNTSLHPSTSTARTKGRAPPLRFLVAQDETPHWQDARRSGSCPHHDLTSNFCPNFCPNSVPQLRLICHLGLDHATSDTHLCLNSGVEAKLLARVFHEQTSNLCLNLGQVEAELRQKSGHKLGSDF
ncbi:hypothetical protein B0H16DRAFT_1693427 [Mycena metata]|uniref:Uncharacterized protein n=1 Tax=Mycena metata TaxID=1033252 RepID=A0AAD7N349_9AGAR|nr:hypothetical protein B0H16DRAFT_1693427 [Mycena metata]